MADPIAEAFQKFVAALRKQDVEAFRALCVDDALPQETLFVTNAKRLSQGNMSLRLTRVAQQEDAAEAHFDVVDAAGKRVDSGAVTFTREAEGWRIRAL